MVRQTLSEISERNAIELPKYPGSCALREQPPPYMDVDLEQQHSTDPPGYQNGSPSRDSNRDESGESNICLSELYEPMFRCEAQQILTRTNLNRGVENGEADTAHLEETVQPV